MGKQKIVKTVVCHYRILRAFDTDRYDSYLFFNRIQILINNIIVTLLLLLIYLFFLPKSIHFIFAMETYSNMTRQNEFLKNPKCHLVSDINISFKSFK